MQNLDAPSCQAAEPGILEFAEGCLEGPLTDPGQVEDFYRGKRLDRGLRRRRADCAQDFQVNAKLPGGVQAADHVNFRRAVGMRRCCALCNFIDGEFVRRRVTPPFAERTKGAIQNANVGIIDMPVDDVIRAVPVPPVPFPSCQGGEFGQVVRFKEEQCFALGQTR